MKTTSTERNEARKGCHFYHQGYCLSILNSGQSFCTCIRSLKESKARGAVLEKNKQNQKGKN
jgi:hypothetical protein